MKRSRNRNARAAPVELGEKELGDVAGGYHKVVFQDALVTGYQLSGSSDAATTDGTADVIVAAGR